MTNGTATVRTEGDGIDTATRALIVGLGATGLSAARWLASRGAAVAVTDSRERPPGLQALQESLPDAALFIGGFSQLALDHADMLVLSPGVPLSDPFVRQAEARGLPVIGDIELFARAAAAPVIAVTGSNGKSTVTTLLGMMAERAGIDVRVGGNLGTPALDLLGVDEPELYVLELSSFQLETTASLDASAAAVLNVSADHLDRYAGIDAYAAAKARIWSGTGAVIANRDDPLCAALVPPHREVTWFGLTPPRADGEYGLRTVDGVPWLCCGEEQLMRLDALKMAGLHNAANALAALALGAAAGMPPAPMVQVLEQFGGLPHRMEWVAERDGTAWYNDSKATNVGATLAAVAGFDRPLVLIVGGDGKGQDFAPLAEALRGKAHDVVVIGRDAERIGAALQAVCTVHTASDMAAAVRAASRVARPGDGVLLSPACSSLDMFENFEARGRAFAEAVRGLT
ncbi:MAG: UDP-N-acetylmuramoyl-L-alanine--D-glutamate ligase [Xanthomonadaceae bacterium]|nr:UDP-N-acetylmuramoyl-L-alanine--D-glutamate ligase [Xanthomonadaceae bacterium]